MDARTKIGAGVLGISAAVTGTIDATTLKEVPLERLEIVAEERVEAKQIGNRVETTFPWKDQEGIKVTYDMGAPGVLERVRDKRKQEVITEVVDFGDGGFKIDVLLNERPESNKFCYLIEGSEQYDFFYQLPLNEEPQEEGLSCTETQCTDKEGNVVSERPEDIVGSYAVYHKELKNHVVGRENYAAGKVMHIPRPQVWELNDEVNTKEWAELSYDEKKGELCVTARQEFLDEATYPVRIDPTFGYTSVGGTTSSFEDDYLIGFQQVSSGEAGNVTNISVYVSSLGVGDPIIAGIYDSHAGGVRIIISNNSTNTNSTAHWEAINVSGTQPIGGTENYFAVSFDNETNAEFYFDNLGGSAWGRSLNSRTYDGSLPNPATFASKTFVGARYSIYATYTAGGGGDLTPAQDVIWFH